MRTYEMEPHGISWNPTEPYGANEAVGSLVEPYGMEPHGTLRNLWSPSEPYGPTWCLGFPMGTLAWSLVEPDVAPWARGALRG